MNRIIKFMICIIMVVMTTLSSYESVQASVTHENGVPFVNENGDVETIALQGQFGLGTWDYDFTADLTKADEILIKYGVTREKCCSNPSFSRETLFKVLLDGHQIHYCDEYDYVDTIYDVIYNDYFVNAKSYRRSSASMKASTNCIMRECNNCHHKPYVQFRINKISAIDRRGKAENVPRSVHVEPLGTTTISYDFNEYAANVRWVVKYKGESSFTPLDDGQNRDGLKVSGAYSKSLTLSNVPKSFNGSQIGALVYDSDGQLPANTSYPNTPYYTTVDVYDATPPIVEINKKIDTNSKSVIIEVIASDNVGLGDKPYSYDGGSVYISDNTKAVTAPGIITVAVRDLGGNVTRKEIAVDAIDIEKANPKNPSTEEGIKDPGTDTGKGNSGNSGNTGGSSGTGGNNGGSSGTGGNAGNKTDAGGGSAGTGTLDNIKDGNKEFVSTDKTVSDTITTVEQSKKTNNKNTSGNNSNNNNSKNTSLKAKELTDNDKEDVFERIRKNSEDYIISMRETKKEEPKAAEAEKAAIDLKTIEEGDDADAYINENSDEADAYNPEKKEKSIVSLVLIFAGLILLLIILAIILFFGVIVFVKKDTEYTMLSNEEGIKVPVALLFVSFRNSERYLCFYELLNKYDDLYVRFGPLFAYIYENEKISIMTKFKGEKKREIAKEVIAKEIVVGKTGGKKK